MSQRKHVLDILEEIGMLDCKPIDTPRDSNVKLALGQGASTRSKKISTTYEEIEPPHHHSIGHLLSCECS